MQKQSTKFKLGLLAVTALSAVTVAVTPIVATAFADSTAGDTNVTAVFEDRYMSGETLNIPEHKISDGRKEYDSNVIVVTPSGVTLTGRTVILSEAGRYTVSYVANKEDGTVLREDYSFISADRLYSVTSPLSTVGYGHSVANYDISTDVVLASVSSRDRFEYSPMINLNELAGSEFIEFFVTPEVIGTPDAMTIQIVLTDAHDENNFVVISVKKGTAAQAGAAWAEINSYITANAVGQVPAGLESGYTGITVYDKQYRLQKGTVWGANIRFALPGNPGYTSLESPNNDPEKVASQSLKISLDNETGDIYANGQLVSVLKNSDIYDDVLWSGFTTGECYLSVYGESFNSASLGLGIVSLGGTSFKDGDAGNIFLDTTAPEITVDYGGESGVPNAVAGKPYSLFNVTAVDDYSGVCPVSGKVFYCTQDGGQVRIDIKDNSFVPIREGKYKIVYTASDRNGNSSEQVVEVTAEASGAETLTADVADAVNGSAGAEYQVAVPVFSNARGVTRWSAVASLDGNEEVKYEISSEDASFIPEYAGNYTLTYTYGDYIVTGSLQKTFTVTASRTPVIHGTPSLPKYLILGCEYQLPELTGTAYTDGVPVPRICEIFVKEDGGSERKINGKLITYAEQYLEIIYRITDGEGIEIRSEKIPVIDVGYNGAYKIENYFYGEDFSAAANRDYIRFVADKTGKEKAQMTFINPLQTFDFVFRAYASGNGFNKLGVILTDSCNENVQIKFTYRYEAGQVFFAVNNGEEVLLSTASFNDAASPLFLSFNGLTNTVMPTGVSALSYQVTHDLSGAEFKGFENMTAYMTVETDGITNNRNAALNIVSINGQRISNVFTDITRPQLSATTASGDRLQGTEYVIKKVYAADVLDVVYGTMSVTAPDGSYVVAKDGTEIKPGSPVSRDYTIVLEKFGAYTVTYEVTDICGNKLTYEYVLRAADFTPPDVKIVSPVTEASVNSAIKVADIVISDNKDETIEDFTIFVTVTTPDFRSHSLTDTEGNCASTFTVEKAGEYTVTYLVIDSSGNMTNASYKINVR